MLEDFWKYYGQWNIFFFGANGPFSIIFSIVWYFKGIKMDYYGVKRELTGCIIGLPSKSSVFHASISLEDCYQAAIFDDRSVPKCGHVGDHI